MSDTKNSSDKTLTIAPSKTISLKRPVEQGMVRQSFSHGRTKPVVVEKVKHRVVGRAEMPPKEAPAAVVAAPVAAPTAVAPVAAAPLAAASSVAASSVAVAPVAVAPVAVTPVAAAPVTAAPVATAPVQARTPAQVTSPARAPQTRVPPQPPVRAPAASPAAPAQRGGAAPLRPTPTRPSGGVVLRTLTEEERDARTRALVDARGREEEDRRLALIEAKAREEREERERIEREAAVARKRDEDARRLSEGESKRRSEEEAQRRLGGGEPAVAPPSTGLKRVATIGLNATPATQAPGAPGATAAGLRPVARPTEVEEEEAKKIIRRPGLPTKVIVPPKPTRGTVQKDRGRLTVTSATAEEEERTRSVASFRRRTQRLKGGGAEQKEKLSREVILPETITIQELASRMSERAVDVIRLLMKQGQMAVVTDVIDADTAELIATEMGHSVRRVADADVEEGLFDIVDQDDDEIQRPPVVTIMGHVDHGKTSLLDAIRSATVQTGEAGGITQHIGAYQVSSPGGQAVTFIDTPGHAAFTAMRARGAKVTDIIVLVVAADDGVMPQTVEAIAHAKAAQVPMIVAINKIDKPDAKPERVRAELLQHQVQVESLGGDVLEVEVSALKQTNLDKLLEIIALQSEVLDLKSNPERPAEGTVIEARLDKGRGPVATVLVQRGTLRVGDLIVAGSVSGRVRALLDDKGAHVDEAGPSFPVEILGFSSAPDAGDRIAVVTSEARAREITEYRERQKREKLAARGAPRGSLVDMMSQLKAAGRKEFPLVVKGDVQGSVEAILSTLENLNTDEVAARILHAGVGGISESDVTLAEASKAVIIGFNVRANKEARSAAETAGVEVRYYNIIYNLVDDVKAAMSGLLSPTLRETMLGNALILQVFNITKVGKVAGCKITDGNVERGAHVRLIRDNVVVHEGKLSTLKRFKDEVKEVVAGQECGMAFEKYEDMREGDVIECYRVDEVKRSL